MSVRGGALGGPGRGSRVCVGAGASARRDPPATQSRGPSERRALTASRGGATGPRARAHARTHAGAGAGARPPVATVGAEAQGEVACRGSPGSRRRGGRGRMAEGTQPQQPSQLGPGAGARGMKRESELDLPVPGGGGDGAEPGLSKRPRTEEAVADGGGGGGGGMQVTARDGCPVTAGVRREAWRAAQEGGPGLPGLGMGWASGVLTWKWEGACRGLVERWGEPRLGGEGCSRTLVCPRGSQFLRGGGDTTRA